MSDLNPRCYSQKQTSIYISDPKLCARIRQYLEVHTNQFIGIDAILEHLQFKYSEYSRKKKSAFKKCVQKAYLSVSKEIGSQKDAGDTYTTHELNYLKKRKAHPSNATSDLEQYQNSNSEDFSDCNEEYMEYKDQNAVNNLVSGMYKSRKPSYSAPSSACPSPKRQDQMNQDPDLGKSLFMLDRTGSHKKANQKQESWNKSLSSTSTPKGITEKSLDSKINKLDNTSSSITTENNLSNLCHSSSKLVSVEEVESSFSEKKDVAVSKKDKDDDTSVKSGHAVKKKRRVEREVKKKGPKVQMSEVTFSDIGGIEIALKEVCKLLIHMKHPEVYHQLGITPPRGFLLHGPPGCGKTLLANAIAGELAQPMIKISAPEIVSGVSGESEEKLRDLFESAINSSPCVLFIDEIDSICQKRENASKDMERRIVAQLLTCMDELNDRTDIQVLVIGATNRPDTLDPALRRAGRFDREICMGIPGEKARQRILEVLCRGLRLEDGFDFCKLARNTPGYVGADLMALSREAAITAVNRVFITLQEKQLRQQKTDITADINYIEIISTAGSVKEDTKNLVNESAQLPDASSVVTQSKDCDMEVEEGTEQIIPDSSNNSLSHDDAQTVDTSTEVQAKLCPEMQAPDKDQESLNSVLRWLKDQPPLTVEELSTLFITMQDFETALKHVQPSAKREGFATIPDVTWDDIGALQNIREELHMAILAPVHHPEQFKALGLTNPPGILLAGPPGCGKTLLAKAVANESGLNFISVKGPELLNMYVGESERAVRQVFQRARNSAPCVIFFDELDSLCPRRTGSGEGGSSVRVVNQLLTEMDGLEERKQVFIMGATNRPDIIDPAILRPGRLDKQLYVGLPNVEDRQAILNTLTKNGTKPRLSEDVNLQEIACDPKCECFTGADLAALVREASVVALKEYMASNAPCSTLSVSKKHFDVALTKVKPSVSKQDLNVYKKMRISLDTS